MDTSSPSQTLDKNNHGSDYRHNLEDSPKSQRMDEASRTKQTKRTKSKNATKKKRARVGKVATLGIFFSDRFPMCSSSIVVSANCCVNQSY